jgi:hypothetical protein
MKPPLVLAALGRLAGPALAETAPKAPAKPADPDKLICKTRTKTGSRFPEKTCMTKAQWDELWAKSRDITANAQTRGYRANSGG